MNITINTATVVQGDREVPLTRAIVRQLPFLRDKWDRSQLKCIGDVRLDEFEILYLIQTPEGLCQSRAVPHISITDNGNITRIILIK